MTVALYDMDGVTLVTELELPSLDLPRVDDLPKVALWNERAFVLLSSRHAANVHASYVEVVSLRLELPSGIIH